MELESIIWHLVAAVPSEIGESTPGHFVFRLAALKNSRRFAAS
jgi:hypothetical protein